MKKVLAVFLSILMAFSAFSLIAYAKEETQSTEATTAEENTTRDIETDSGLVFPTSFTQLKVSILFKVIEKILKFFVGLFGDADLSGIDDSLAEEISSIGGEIQSAIEEGAQFNNNN